MILITGDEGMIGRHVRALLERTTRVVGFDQRMGKDVRDVGALRAAMEGVRGVVHLAAISRVAVAERHQGLAYDTNVNGTRNVLRCAQEVGAWFLNASSREVYGQADVMPVTEEMELCPINHYARTKAAAEEIVRVSREQGYQCTSVRFSNVYGSWVDHADRVVPAFMRAGLQGGTLKVEGGNNVFDFVHVDDVARGVLSLMHYLENGLTPPTVHFTTGLGTTLAELATMCIHITGGGATAEDTSPRTYDVSHFVGDPRKAAGLVGWKPTLPLRDRLEAMAKLAPPV